MITRCPRLTEELFRTPGHVELLNYIDRAVCIALHLCRDSDGDGNKEDILEEYLMPRELKEEEGTPAVYGRYIRLGPESGIVPPRGASSSLKFVCKNFPSQTPLGGEVFGHIS